MIGLCCRDLGVPVLFLALGLDRLTRAPLACVQLSPLELGLVELGLRWRGGVFSRHLSADSLWFLPGFMRLRVLLCSWGASAMSHFHLCLSTSLAVYRPGFAVTGSPQDLSTTSTGGLGPRLGAKVGNLVAGRCLVSCRGSLTLGTWRSRRQAKSSGSLVPQRQIFPWRRSCGGLLCGFIVSELAQPFGEHCPVVGDAKLGSLGLLSHGGLHILSLLDSSDRSRGGQLHTDATERIEINVKDEMCLTTSSLRVESCHPVDLSCQTISGSC